MASLCICGFCIPYSVLWPMILFVLKQVWDFFRGKDAKSKKEAANVSTAEGNQTNDTPSMMKESAFHGYLGDLNDMEQYQKLKDNCRHSNAIFILKFTAKWCKPCQALTPLFEKIVNEQREQVYAVSVDVDDFDELGAKYHAVLLPMMVALQNGKEIGRFRGKEESELRSFVANPQSTK